MSISCVVDEQRLFHIWNYDLRRSCHFPRRASAKWGCRCQSSLLRAFACRGCAYIQPTQIFTHPTAIKIVSTAVDSVAMSRSPEGARKGDALLRKWQKAAARNVVSEPRVPFGDKRGKPGVPYGVKISEIMTVARRVCDKEG